MTHTLIYATTNPAKLTAMENIVTKLTNLPIKLEGLEAYKDILPQVDESGNDPLENARIKALAYYRAIGKPLFSCDSGLFFEGVEADLQPGVHVRNVGGRQLTDEEMTAYYANIAARHGGKIAAKYKNAICLVMNEHEIYEYMGDDLAGEAFYIVDTPHSGTRDRGFPLDCLSVHIESGKYYYDMEHNISGGGMKAGFEAFFRRTLGERAELPVHLFIDNKGYDPEGSVFKRKASRGIVRRGEKYLLFFSKKYGDYKFPGGGVEKGESIEAALVREVKEETGYIVKPETVERYAVVLERRPGQIDDIMEMTSHYFFCHVEEEPSERDLDEYEKEHDYQVVWMTLTEAIELNRKCANPRACPWVKREIMVMEHLVERGLGL